MAQSLNITRDSILCEETLLCSTCLDVFENPVTTPCGHNFCKSCLTQYWATNRLCCPFCDEEFTTRPDLKINASLKEIAELFKKTNLSDKPKVVHDKPEVVCDVCIGEKQKAEKSCLDCGMTFCSSHLEPHSHVAKLQKHKLMNPVTNLADYICQKHEKPLEKFCSDDQKLVCEFCIEVDHRDHAIVQIPDDIGKMKMQLGKTKIEVQQMIRFRTEKIQEIKRKVDLCKKQTMMENGGSVEDFSALIQSIQKCQSELAVLTGEKQKSVERQAEGVIKDLDLEINVLKKRDTELEQLLLTEDNLQLLQLYSTVHKPPVIKNWTDIKIDTDLNVSGLWTALTQLKKILFNTHGKIDLQRVKLYAVDVTLDPETAHSNLILSHDLKQVKYGNTYQNRPYNPKRFVHFFMVLGKQGFSSGRFYFEVQIRGKPMWSVGLVSESVNRKDKIPMRPERGIWTIGVRKGNEWVCNDTKAMISDGKIPQTVGVFVDYEAGVITFYDVEDKCLIISFSNQEFTDKLYPFINPCSDENGINTAPLTISPVL